MTLSKAIVGRSRLKILLSFATVVAVLGLSPANAQFGIQFGGGDRDRYCDEYAERAVEAAERNRRDRCGFDGPRWIADSNAHRFWCGVVPRDVTRRESDERSAQLRQCADRFSGGGGGGYGDGGRGEGARNEEGKRAACDTYAKIALVQTQSNLQFRCNFSGPAWNTSYEPHFQWCRFVRRSTLLEGLRDRAVALQQCFDRLGDFDDGVFDRR